MTDRSDPYEGLSYFEKEKTMRENERNKIMKNVHADCDGDKENCKYYKGYMNYEHGYKGTHWKHV